MNSLIHDAKKALRYYDSEYVKYAEEMGLIKANKQRKIQVLMRCASQYDPRLVIALRLLMNDDTSWERLHEKNFSLTNCRLRIITC